MYIEDSLTTTSSSGNRGRNKAKSTAHLAPSDLPGGQSIDTWPLVPRAGKDCATVARWRGCFEERITICAARGFYGDDEGEYRIDYYCPRRMADNWGCDEADAATRIRDGKPHVKKRREQNAAFNAVATMVVAAVPSVSR